MKPPCAIALEASTDRLGIAARAPAGVVCWETEPARDESPRIFQHCERLLAQVGGSIAALDFVAFGCGPGSFTGVRIAAAAAQALAFARGIPVCRISSFRVLASGVARRFGPGCFGISFDARRQRAYLGLYQVDASGSISIGSADALIDPSSFELPGDAPFVAVGEGWQAYPQLLARHRARVLSIEASLKPSARDLIGLAESDFFAGRTVAAAQALPEYLGQRPAEQL
ncbi:MAG: tRNA (adenosine(37)-N6)-threonylcarbamoyltransferase complex dimerization subunit type 1 TsaB [Gammaproteobacteria bacterium]|nr:MAG: tRNA (adenosine(37)-N6)-threonylcarbamoyltransferase complex dimerization subunit type 1 TsaB [Gammaproteobacteria bacterium]